MRAYVRMSYTEPYELHLFGKKSPDHPSVGRECPACGVAFQAGDYTALVPLGPGDSPENQEKYRNGRWFNAVAAEIHWTCAGEEVAGLDQDQEKTGRQVSYVLRD